MSNGGLRRSEDVKDKRLSIFLSDRKLFRIDVTVGLHALNVDQCLIKLKQIKWLSKHFITEHLQSSVNGHKYYHAIISIYSGCVSGYIKFQEE